MTATAIPGEPRRWVHVSARILPVFPAAAAVLALADAPGWKPGWPLIVLAFTDGSGGGRWTSGSIISIVLTVATVAGIAGYLAHMRMPCMACAARFPLDPQAAAERRRWQLRTTHLLDSRRAYRVILAVLVLPLLTPAGWPANTVSFLQSAAGVVIIVCMSAHSALQPWCPWCGHGHGGETAPAPPPVPALGLPA